MTSLERGSLHASALLTGATGLLYGWLRYFGQRAGEFGMEPHPLQALVQHLHLLASPLLVFALGMVVRAHVVPMWRSGGAVGRASGIALALILAPMVVAGYGVQVATSQPWRLTLAWIHGGSSLAFLAAYGAHLMAPTVASVRANPEEDGISLNPS